MLHTWETWSLFPPAYLIGLNATFLQKKVVMEQSAEDSSNNSSSSSSSSSIYEQLDPETLRLSDDRLKRKCKQAGLVSSGSKLDMCRRLLMLRKFTSVEKSRQVKTSSISSVPLENQTNPLDVRHRGGGTYRDTMALGPCASEEEKDDKDDLDGVPMDEDQHEDLDSHDIDGVPLDDNDDDIDGVPLDDDDDAVSRQG